VNNERVILINHTSSDMISSMKKLAIAGQRDPFILLISDKVQSIQDPREQDRFVHKSIYDMALFEASPKDRQRLCEIPNMVRNRRANCVGYSTMISSVFLNLKRPHDFDLVNTKNEGFNHVYVTTPYSVIDCCLGQKQDGSDTFFNRLPNGMFDEEVEYYYKQKFPMLTIVDGGSRTKLRRRNRNSSGNTNGWFDAILTPILGDQCKLGCNVKHASDETGRLKCKTACDMGLTEYQYDQWLASGGTVIPTPAGITPRLVSTSNNTMLYVGAGLVGLYLFTRKK